MARKPTGRHRRGQACLDQENLRDARETGHKLHMAKGTADPRKILLASPLRGLIDKGHAAPSNPLISSFPNTWNPIMAPQNPGCRHAAVGWERAAEQENPPSILIGNPSDLHFFLAENPSKMGPNQRTGNIFKKTHCQGGSLPIERRRSLRRLQRSAANDGESDRLLSITWRQAFASSRCAVMVAVP